MIKPVRLSLESPVAACGDLNEVWIADEQSLTVTRFDPASAEPGSVISLESPPVDVEVTIDLLWVGHADGSIVGFQRSTGEEALRRSAASGQLRLRSDGRSLWVLDRSDSSLAVLDSAGNRRRVVGRGVITFAPGGSGVYWISETGMMHFGNGEGGVPPPSHLPVDADRTGALVACGNSLWLSVDQALLMVSMRSLEPGARIPAPEGPVRHLSCDYDNRIIGGSRGVFVLDPASDAGVRALELDLKSELRALVPTRDRVWALESAEPLVHIAPVY